MGRGWGSLAKKYSSYFYRTDQGRRFQRYFYQWSCRYQSQWYRECNDSEGCGSSGYLWFQGCRRSDCCYDQDRKIGKDGSEWFYECFDGDETRTRPGAYEFPGEIGMGTGVVGWICGRGICRGRSLSCSGDCRYDPFGKRRVQGYECHWTRGIYSRAGFCEYRLDWFVIPDSGVYQSL